MIPSDQTNPINQYNKVFEEIKESRQSTDGKYKYLTIDKNGVFTTTEDKSNAASLKEVNFQASKIIQEFVSKKNPRMDVEEYQKLAKNLKSYLNKEFPQSSHKSIELFMQVFNEPQKKIIQFDKSAKPFEPANRYEKITKARVLVDFDERSGQKLKETKVNLVSTKSYSEATPKADLAANQLLELRDDLEVGAGSIADAFDAEINKATFTGMKIPEKRVKMTADYPAEMKMKKNPSFVHLSILNTLERLSEQVKNGVLTTISVEKFTDELIKEMIAKNDQSQDIDRETFAEIFGIGKHEGLPLFGEYDNVTELINEYESNEWKPDETRKMSVKEVNEMTLDHYIVAIEKFKNDKALQTILNYFVNQMKQK